MAQNIALVTGGGRGIGRAIAHTLSRAGYDVGVNYRNSADGAADVCEQIRENGQRGVAIRADVTNLDDIDRMFDQVQESLGTPTLLVNNAGTTRFRPFLEVDPAMWEEVNMTDWRGPFFCAQRAAKLMVAEGIGGVIINITSNQQDGCWPHASVYGPAKAALAKFTRHAALELGQHNIRVNAIAPGYTVSRGQRPRTGASEGPAARIPLRRFAHADEVAEAVVYLVSDSASYITGTCLRMDGGALLPVLAENEFV